jgi:hypothetical protein
MKLECFFCGRSLVQLSKLALHGKRAPDNLYTEDHLTPKSRADYSKTHPVKVPACHSCNNEKGCLTGDEYRAVLAYRAGVITVNFKFAGEKL